MVRRWVSQSRWRSALQRSSVVRRWYSSGLARAQYRSPASVMVRPGLRSSADLFFQAEMAAVQQFTFGFDEAGRVAQPVLNAVGADSVRRFVEGGDVVQSWFPDAERVTIPAAGHLLMVENPDAVAAGLTSHFTRHCPPT
jgi:pimeloyl-ACP methyl ester carboxylesterase